MRVLRVFRVYRAFAVILDRKVTRAVKVRKEMSDLRERQVRRVL